jgi:hypothetical protein
MDASASSTVKLPPGPDMPAPVQFMFRLATASKPDEMWHHRGVAFAPALGGLATVSRRACTGHVTAHSAIARTGYPPQVMRLRADGSPIVGLDDGGCTEL